MDAVVEAVLMGIKALREVGVASRAIVQKCGAYLEYVAAKFLAVLVGYLVCLVLVDNEKVIIVDVVYLTADEKAFAAREAEKELAAIVDMYIGVRISLLGVVYAKASVVAGVGDSFRAAFKNVVHFMVSLSWSGKLMFVGERGDTLKP